MAEGRPLTSRRIQQVDFEILSNEFEAQYGVVPINDLKRYESNVPRTHGVNSLAMGPVVRRYACATCGQDLKDCPGHPGILTFPLPIYHFGFFPVVFRVLSAVCYTCSALKLTQKEKETALHIPDPHERYRWACKVARDRKTCYACGKAQPQWGRDTFQITATFPKGMSPSDRDFFYDPSVRNTGTERDCFQNVVRKGKEMDMDVEEGEDEPPIEDGEEGDRDDDEEGNDDDVENEDVDEVNEGDEMVDGDEVEEDDDEEEDGMDSDDAETTSVGSKRSAAAISRGTAGMAAHRRFLAALAKRGKPMAIAPESVQWILRGIPPLDMRAMGFHPRRSPPERMIRSVLLVPPPCLRPSVCAREGAHAHGEHDLTTKLQDLLKSIRKLEDVMKQSGYTWVEGENHHEYTDAVVRAMTFVQWNYVTFFANEYSHVRRAVKRDGRPLKSLTGRLRGKRGRVRGDCEAKRTDYCARTVVTGDPNIGVEELGVPEEIAMTLTFPERVTELNYGTLQQLVLNGPHKYPGANAVLSGKERRRLDFIADRGAIPLQIGDVVERHLHTGDWVLFNRQPSLHKESMQGHCVRVMKGSTFRLNLATTTPYNADFDGDEMNMHVPRSHAARAELMEIMRVAKHIVSSQSAKPNIGLKQDALLSLSYLTKRDAFFPPSDVQHFLWGCGLSSVPDPPAILRPSPLYTGKQVVSFVLRAVLPTTMPFHYTRRAGLSEDAPEKDGGALTCSDSFVQIRHGNLLSGQLNVRTMGNVSGSIQHQVFLDFGSAAAANVLDGLTFLTTEHMKMVGASVGLDDCIFPIAPNVIPDLVQCLQKLVDREVAKWNPIDAPKNIRRLFEMQVNECQNDLRTRVGAILYECPALPRNSFYNMIQAGKGSAVNIVQVAGLVGPQNQHGKRIPNAISDGTRTLPHFAPFDASLASRGLVANSYTSGLTPTEFFHHAQGGREGLVNTAVGTANTGYSSRRVIKAMESISVCPHGTVRSSTMGSTADKQGWNTQLPEILQFLYGGDGWHPQKMERWTTALPGWTDEEMTRRFRHANEAAFPALRREWENIMRIRHDVRFSGFHMDRKGTDTTVTLWTPIPIERWMLMRGWDNLPPTRTSAATLATIVDEWFADLLANLTFIPDPAVRRGAMLGMEVHARVLLASKVLAGRNVRAGDLRAFCRDMTQRILQSFITPGEMVGILAANALIEPNTQMTLNTFHAAGIRNKAMLGVPHFNEVINASPNIKTPMMTCGLLPAYAQNESVAKRVAASLPFCSLGQLLQSTSVTPHWPPEVPFESMLLSAAVWGWDVSDPPNGQFLTIHLVRKVSFCPFVHHTDFACFAQDPAEVARHHIPFVLIQQRLYETWGTRYQLKMACSPELDTAHPTIILLFPPDVPLLAPHDRENERYSLREWATQLFGGTVLLTNETPTSIDWEVDGIRPREWEDLQRVVGTGHSSMKLDGEVTLVDNIGYRGKGTLQWGGEKPANTPDLYRTDFCQQLLRKSVYQLAISGLTGITDAEAHIQPRWDPTNGQWVMEWVIETSGVNLDQIREVFPIDFNRVTCNHLREAAGVFGIEVTNRMVQEELRSILAGFALHPHHVELVADVMTHLGRLVPMTRHGLLQKNIGPLSQASFERQMDVFMQASRLGRVDCMNGVSDNIMVGNAIRGGTGSIDVIEIPWRPLSPRLHNIDAPEPEYDDDFFDGFAPLNTPPPPAFPLVTQIQEEAPKPHMPPTLAWGFRPFRPYDGGPLPAEIS